MSKISREIVTLQFGHYASFIGTHWWNIQNSAFIYNPSDLTGPKEINNDVLFREGENLMHEVTYTPRLIIFDLKRSLNTLKETGTLYDVQAPGKDVSCPWEGKLDKFDLDSKSRNEFLQDLDFEEALERGVMLHAEKDTDEVEMEGIEAGDSKVFEPKFYDLDNSVTVWSDFLKPHLHPKTMAIIKNFQHGNDLETFDIFGYGVDVYKEQRDEIEDHLRFFAEECDNLEGFILLVDSYNAFGGLASSFLLDALDDYRKKSSMIYSVSPTTFPNTPINKEHYQLLNVAMSYDGLLPNSSVFFPMSLSSSPWKATEAFRKFPYLKYRVDLPYHTSALLAANIDTITLPLRLEDGPMSMNDMICPLTQFERKLMSTYASFPLPIDEYGSLLDTLSRDDGNISRRLQSLMPYVSECSVSPFSQHSVLRGVESPRRQGFPESAADGIASVNDVILRLFEKTFRTHYQFSTTVRQPCKVVAPYPNIFSTSVTSSGQISPRLRNPCQGVQYVPALTLVQSSVNGKVHLDALCTEVERLKLHRLTAFVNAGLESDQFNEVLESLRSQTRAYEDSVDMD